MKRSLEVSQTSIAKRRKQSPSSVHRDGSTPYSVSSLSEGQYPYATNSENDSLGEDDIGKGMYGRVRRISADEAIRVLWDSPSKFAHHKLGEMPAHGTTVAVKKQFLAKSSRNEVDILHKLSREPEVARFVPKFYFSVIDTNKRYIYLVMEFLQGKTLRATMQSAGGLDPTLVAQMEHAMYLVGKYIGHTDLHASNVMVTDDGHIKIIDFGFVDNPRGHSSLHDFRKSVDASFFHFTAPYTRLNRDVKLARDSWHATRGYDDPEFPYPWIHHHRKQYNAR